MPRKSGASGRPAGRADSKKVQSQQAESKRTPRSARGSTALEPAQGQRASSDSPQPSTDSAPRTASAGGQIAAVKPQAPPPNPFRDHVDLRSPFSTEASGPSGSPSAARSYSDRLPGHDRLEVPRSSAGRSTPRATGQTKPTSPSLSASRSPSEKTQAMADFEKRTRLAIRDRFAAGKFDSLTIKVNQDRRELLPLRTSSHSSRPDGAHTDEDYIELQAAESLGDEYRALSKQQDGWEEVAVRVLQRCERILAEIEADGSGRAVSSRDRRISAHVHQILTDLDKQCGKAVSDYM